MKPLNVGKLLKVSAEEAKEYYQTGKLEARMREKGIPLPRMPQTPTGAPACPEMPTSLHRMGNVEISELQAQFGAFADYVGGQVSLAREDANKLKERKDRVEAEVFKESTGRSVKDREATVKLDRRYMEVTEAYIEAQSFYAAARTALERLERDTAIISRETTIRQNQIASGERGRSRPAMPTKPL